MAVTPYTPEQFLSMARDYVSVPEKIAILKRLTQAYPTHAVTAPARQQLIHLLMNANRYDEALQQYRQMRPEPGAGRAIDFKLFELLLRAGKYNDVLRATAAASGPERDLLRDLKLLEIRVQALLAKGLFRSARTVVDDWLVLYAADGVPGTRFETDVRSIQFLQKHLSNLERMNGPIGKSIFTASVPDSLRHWSKQSHVPIRFFKLIPARPSGQLRRPMLAGLHESDLYFEEQVAEMNRGFDYISGSEFSLSFLGVETLYISEGDMDPASSGGHLLTSRVYVHTLPQLYKLSGEAFVVLIDYRTSSEDEAAYMGDGIIQLSASKFEPLVLMHEILHGLGATHQDWNILQAQGYRFDPEDRGLMTFQQGQIVDLGLEEKNRALLGWPHVGVIRPSFKTKAKSVRTVERPFDALPEDEGPATAVVTSPRSPELLSAL